MFDVTVPIILAIILLGAFCTIAVQKAKKIIKIFKPDCVEMKTYKIFKIISPVIFCVGISILTPIGIWNLIGLNTMTLSMESWFGVFSGLLSNLSYAAYKKALGNIGVDISIANRPDKNDEED